MVFKRLFDIISSALGLLCFLPIGLIIAMCIVCESKGGVFYRQVRVGKDNVDFTLIKFRTMRPCAEQQGLLTVGAHDARITKVGYFLRKYKIDEIPQLWNVLNGEMSIVGPRPEVRKYVDLYTPEQRRVLIVRPGLTDYASVEYVHENEILATSPTPEKTYVEEIMPAKLRLNLQYIQNQTLLGDIRLIFKTFTAIFKR